MAITISGTGITSSQIEADGIDGTKIADNSIGIEHLEDDTVGVAELSATGTASTSTFLRGDNSWVSALPTAGGTMTGAIDFGDNVKANFGTSDDLQIYHDGYDSYIDNTVGKLYITDSAGDIYIQAKKGENSIYCNNDGEVKLYHDNSQKIATTSTGIVVTGAITTDGITEDASGNVGINQTVPDAKLEIRDTGSEKTIYIVDTDNVCNQSSHTLHINKDLSGSDACTADRTHTGIRVDIDSSATGGDISDEHRIYGIYNQVNSTGDSDLQYAAYNYVEAKPSAGTVTNSKGAYNYAVGDPDSGASVTNVYGSHNVAYAQGAGDVTTVYGAVGWANIDSNYTGSNITTVSGLVGEVEMDASGTVDNAYGVRGVIDRNAGTITDGFLFYGDYQGTLPTNAWGVYITDAVDNYFAGKLGIDNSAPESKLNVGANGITTLKPSVQISDTTNGATMSLRGQSPIIAFDVTSSGVAKILTDGAGLEIKDGTLDSQGTVDFKITSSGNVDIGSAMTIYGAGDVAAAPDIQLHGAGLIATAGTMYLNFNSDGGTSHLHIKSGGDTSAANSLLELEDDGTLDIWDDLNAGWHSGRGYNSGEKGIRAYAGASDSRSYMFGRNVADGSDVFQALVDGNTTFEVDADGDSYNDGVWSTSNADYAEMFEWSDGNTDNEDRVGYSVVLDGTKIRKATSDDDASVIIGVVSARAGILGDSGHLGWKNKAPTDEFGRREKVGITCYEWEKDGEEFSVRGDKIPEGLVVPDDAESLVRYEDAVSEDYDSTLEYIPRRDRQEWDAIGLMGKLRIRKGQPVGDRWIKMQDVSEAVEEWLVR